MKAKYKICPIKIAGFCLFAAVAVQAQATRTISTIDRRIDTMTRQTKEYEQDAMNREGKGDDKRGENAARSRLIRAEIEEDLKGLQAVYNNMATALQSKSEVTVDFARDSASIVRKHAGRLKTNLLLPKPDETEEKFVPAVVPDGTRKSLTALCKQIYDFITNPIFETSTGLNVEHSIKARRSLDAIIQFTDKMNGKIEP